MVNFEPGGNLVGTQITLRAVLGAIQRHERQISFDALAEAERSTKVRPKLRAIDLHRLLTPYVSVRFAEQLWAVVPLALMLIGFQALALRTSLLETQQIAIGIFAVMVGLMLFMEGLKHGLMPFSENIGHLMPQRFSLAAVLGVAFVLGAAATFAEPAIGALQTLGSLGFDRTAGALAAAVARPNYRPAALVLAVAAAVGPGGAGGMLRFMLGWRLKKLVVLGSCRRCCCSPPGCAQDPELAPVIGLAWDCGGITTGPVTVPVVLALGIGVAAGGRAGATTPWPVSAWSPWLRCFRP